MDRNKTLIVIPYFAEAAQGHELVLAVEGWRQHFKEPYHIAVIGDWDINVHSLHPYRRDTDVSFIWQPRVDPIEEQYTPHLDIVNKFKRIHEVFPDCEGFIYACDDMYAVQDFGLNHVIIRKRPDRDHEIRESWDWRQEGGWLRDLGKTAELCRLEGIPALNWVCHLPVYYEMNELLRIISKYRCDRVSYVLENIYFNQPRFDGMIAVNKQIYGYEVKTANPGIRTAEGAGTTWITNANCGWSEELESVLINHYKLNL